MSTESQVQLLAEGAGPKVRTLKQTDPSAVDASGGAQADVVRHQQVISLADRRGDLAATSTDELILEELRGVRGLLETISAQLG